MNNKEDRDRKSIQEIAEECMQKHGNNITEARICVMNEELKRGYELMQEHPQSVTVFGSARLAPETEIYKRTKNLSAKIAESGYTVVTGGGHGLMKAANEGAYSVPGGVSVGINISLPFEQTLNEHLHDSIEFHHFFSRKVTLAYSAEAYVFCPGGFGTMDEFFEILTLKQTQKIFNVPIILYGAEFWKPLDDYIKKYMLKTGEEVISPEDRDLYIITDNDDEIVDIIKKAPVRTEIATLFGLG